MKVISIFKRHLSQFGIINKVLYKVNISKVLRLSQMYETKDSSWRDVQREFLYEILCYAKLHSMYYKQYIPDSLELSNCFDVLKDLPLLTKDIIREKKDYIYSDEIDNNNWANTGGSTGEPLCFPILKSRHNMEQICQSILYHKMGVSVPKDLIISIDGTRIPQNSIDKNVYWKSNSFNFPYGKYCLSTIYMSEKSMPYYIDFLNHVKPNVMRGYPSGFSELSNYCKNHHVKLNFKLKGIYLTSENFGEEEEELISEVFDCPVWGQYGHTEESVFAVKSPQKDSYICNPLYGFTEILNESGDHVGKGQIGEIVVTGFNHYGLPFIRYKTGDLAEYGGSQDNGSVVINKLLGRSVDYLINSLGEKVYLVGFIFGGHLKAFNNIRQWQLEQYEKGIVEMKTVKGFGYSEQVDIEIKELFVKYNMTVNIHFTNAIEKTGRGKIKFLIQHLT